MGTPRRIRLKRSWSEPAVIWIVIVGQSGSLKSPAQDLALKFVRRLQDALLREYFAELEEYESKLIDYENDLVDWKKNKRHGGTRPENPQKPICRRLLCSDTTVESIAILLQDAPRGLLLARDELAGWLGSFNQYKGGRGHDVAHWLEMHRAGYLLVDRKSGPVKLIHVPRAAVSITGGIQPEVLKCALGREHFEDGLAPRLLLAMPPRKQKRWTETEISPAIEEELARVFGHLYSLDFGTDEQGDACPIDLPLTTAAKRSWIEFYDEHASEQVELTGDLAAAWSKLKVTPPDWLS